jgi:hypothetical protein
LLDVRGLARQAPGIRTISSLSPNVTAVTTEADYDSHNLGLRIIRRPHESTEFVRRNMAGLCLMHCTTCKLSFCDVASLSPAEIID